MIWLLLLLLGGLTTVAVLGEYPCDSMPLRKEMPEGPSLPNLPDQYEATIEVNILQKKKSFLVKESYDFPNKMAAVHMTSYNMTTANIIDFKAGERYSFAPNESCVTYSISDRSPGNIFGFLLRSNGSVHFATSADVFRFGRTYKETYIGTDEIRGIPVNHWVSCQHSDELHATFRLDYFFSRDDFLNPTNNTDIPVRLIIKGQAQNEDPLGNVKPTGSHNFSHVYEYSYFRPGPIRDQTVFYSPKGVVCTGRKNVKELPTMPHQFTVDMESSNPLYSRTFRTYYDNTFKLTRTDSFYTLGDQIEYGGGLVSVIQDLDSEVVYAINQHEGNCTMYSLGSQPLGHMKNVYDMLDISNKTYVYQGKRLLRDMVVDAWGNVSSDDIVQELYFLPPSDVPWQRPRNPHGPGPNSGSHQGHRGNPMPIPEQLSRLVGIFRRNTSFKPNVPGRQRMGRQRFGQPNFGGETTLHIYNFVSGHPDLQVFDISPCYPDGAREMFLQFFVRGKYSKDVSGRRSEFYTALRKVIAKVAGISLLRVGSLHIQQSHSDPRKMRVVLSLFDKIPSTVKAKKGFSEFGLDQAYSNLHKAFNHNGLAFTVGTRPNDKWYTVEKDSFGKTQNPSAMNSSGRYSAASMTGLGIGMILLGSVLGLLIAFIIYRRVNPELSIPYERNQ